MHFRAEEDCPAAAGSYLTYMVAAAGSECSPDRRTDHLLCSSPPEHPLLLNGPDKRPTSSDTLVTDESAATVAVTTPNALLVCEAVKAQYKSVATVAMATTDKRPASDPRVTATAHHAVTTESTARTSVATCQAASCDDVAETKSAPSRVLATRPNTLLEQHAAGEALGKSAPDRKSVV